MLVIPALKRQRKEDCKEFEASLGYTVNLKPACTIEWEPIKKNPKQNEMKAIQTKPLNKQTKIIPIPTKAKTEKQKTPKLQTKITEQQSNSA